MLIGLKAFHFIEEVGRTFDYATKTQKDTNFTITKQTLVLLEAGKMSAFTTKRPVVKLLRVVHILFQNFSPMHYILKNKEKGKNKEGRATQDGQSGNEFYPQLIFFSSFLSSRLKQLIETVITYLLLELATSNELVELLLL